ncbi:hypothetical protein DICPUDRAFT_150294 [Dictyostelium purpureum]|uniref:Peroxin-3 n=1 Tax=Dictyostelium purpureum TaxID=5786 RepID=F0ZFY8_DICPU|nr:uncharacterized protein DICPUDRAFT_150294 [Dictyostelium purpureum]EGC37146.1 hypothetical protein DICPUDRAFT_150294 [Dictyostelium purpureum]|eukprot:XP_003286349.1 hypothetical protein DICPUDRAFT_150294 [Dictyostelium purpureum]
MDFRGFEDLKPNKFRKAYEDVKRVGGFLNSHKLGVFLVSLSGGVAFLYHNITQSHKKSLIQFAKERVETYFNATQNLCNRETESIFIKFIDERKFLEKIETPSIASIRQQKDPQEKQKLTDQLKVSIITKLFSVLYVIPLIIVLNRLQINLIGKYCYLDYILYKDQDVSKNRYINQKTEENFISSKDHCYFFDNKFSQFINLIQEQIKVSLKDWKIDQQSSFEGILKLLINIRGNFEKKEILTSTTSDKSLLYYLIPSEEEFNEILKTHKTPENDNDIQYEYLAMLYNETRNIFESQKFYEMFKECINETFLEFTQSLRADFESPELKNKIDQIVLPDLPIEMEIPKPLATMHNIVLLPKINKQITNILAKRTLIVDKLSTFSSIKKLNYSILTNDLDFNKLQFN